MLSSKSNHFQAKLISIDKNIEELVILEINDVRLNCFLAICPYKIVEGNTYLVELEFYVSDELKYWEATTGEQSITCIDDSFQYQLSGYYEDSTFDFGISVTDKELFLDEEIKNGSFVTIEVDRIDVEFL